MIGGACFGAGGDAGGAGCLDSFFSSFFAGGAGATFGGGFSAFGGATATSTGRSAGLCVNRPYMTKPSVPSPAVPRNTIARITPSSNPTGADRLPALTGRRQRGQTPLFGATVCLQCGQGIGGIGRFSWAGP